MRIIRVNGDAGPTTFTPDVRYNFYTIVGCSFGEFGPSARVYIYQGSAFHHDFQVQEWHDNGLKLNLDPSLSGILDQDNVTLVVQRADFRQASRDGFRFYAARTDPFLLNRVPTQATSLQQALYFMPYYYSPGSVAEGNAVGYSTLVSRYLHLHHDRPTGSETAVTADGSTISIPAPNRPGDKFIPFFHSSSDSLVPPTDTYNLDKLARGFEVDVVDFLYMQVDPARLCGGNLDSVASQDPPTTYGSWDAKWISARQIVVSSQIATCTELEMFVGTYIKDADYRLAIYVSGPRCVDPWTAQPDQACIASGKKR